MGKRTKEVGMGLIQEDGQGWGRVTGNDEREWYKTTVIDRGLAIDTDREGSKIRDGWKNREKDPSGDRDRDQEEETIEQIGTGSGLLFFTWRRTIELCDFRFCSRSGLTHKKTACHRIEMTFPQQAAGLGAS
jgi:hypothetical protein